MPDQSVNYDYWYDDQDIKEALEICEKLPVGLKEPPTINQNDQYDIYVHIPYPIDYFSFTDNQILFLRDLLNYFIVKESEVKKRRVAWPLNIKAKQHWATLGIICEKPNTRVAQQLLDKLRALDKQAQRKETLSFNATEQYLADQDVQKLLTQLYDNVQVTWYDTLDNTLRNNQDLQTPLLRALQRAHPQVQQIDFEKPVSQGMNDCGVLTVKIVSDFLRGEQPVLAKQHVDQDNIKALRYTHYQQCPGIQARQQRADLYHSKQDGSGQIQSTTDIRQQVKTLTNQVPSIASAFQSFTDTTLDINRCFDETVKGINDLQNISEEQRQQMLNTMQIIYNTVPNALHFVYQRIMPGAHYMDKLQSAKSEFNYNARKARRIMQVRDGAIALGSLFFGVSEIAETSGFSICTIFDDSVCKDATVIASQASRYICLIVFGGIAIIANRVGQNYDKEAKVKKQELMHTENKTSLTELVNQVDQQSPFATSQADNQQKQNSQNSQDNQQPVQQLLGYMGFK